jgi:hypothetical protein
MDRHVKTQPPWDFLRSASRASLQSYELSRLSHAANVRKEIVQLLDVWMEETSAALLARWLMDEREQSAHGSAAACGCAARPRPPRPVSDNFLAEPALPVPRIRSAM